MSERIRRLLRDCERFDDAAGISRRREDLLDQLSAAGHPREYGDLILDLAEEEKVDAAVAVGVVTAGVGVRELAPVRPDHWEETQVEAPPGWVNAGQPAAGDAARERLLRTTFRRLRQRLESGPGVAAALAAFAREPDVGDVDY